MHIGIDATALPPDPVGAGTYIIQLIRALAGLETEHEFTVFAQTRGQALIARRPLPGLGWVTAADKSPMQRLAWEQIVFPGLVRRSGVELLHSLHYTRPLALPCASVVTFHDLTFFLFPQLHTRSKRLFFPAAMRFSARKADALVAISENTRQDAIRLLGVPPQKIFTTPLGVSEDFRPLADSHLREAVRSKYHLPEQFILYVGLVEPRKNLSLLLSAYKKLGFLKKIPPLVIVGRLGWMYQEVFRQVEVLELKEKVLFVGYVPGADLPIVYNLAVMFVYPSIYEGFGLPPLEAMACGTPVVTTAVSSMPEHVGEAGVLVPPQDEQALAQAMFEVLANQELRDQLAVRGPQQAARYTWKRTAQETLEVYQQAMRSS